MSFVCLALSGYEGGTGHSLWAETAATISGQIKHPSVKVPSLCAPTIDNVSSGTCEPRSHFSAEKGRRLVSLLSSTTKTVMMVPSNWFPIWF